MPVEVKYSKLPNGVSLQYAEQGEESGTPIIFLHGISDSWRSFERVLPNLPESVHAFALTFRGHGDSSRPAEGYLYQDFAKDVVEFMDLNNLDSTIIVACSTGCYVAEFLAAEHPERVEGLILVSFPYSQSENQALNEFREYVLSSLEDPVPVEFVREFQESTLVQTVPEDFLEAMIEESLKMPASVWKAMIKGFLQDDPYRAVKKFKTPTLLVWGDQDSMSNKSDQNELQRIIENSKLLVYEGVGHAVHWEEPEKFTSDLLSFIKNDLTGS